MMSQYVRRAIAEAEYQMLRCPQLVTPKDLKERISRAMHEEHCVNYNALKEKEEEPSKKAKAYIKRKIV